MWDNVSPYKRHTKPTHTTFAKVHRSNRQESLICQSSEFIVPDMSPKTCWSLPPTSESKVVILLHGLAQIVSRTNSTAVNTRSAIFFLSLFAKGWRLVTKLPSVVPTLSPPPSIAPPYPPTGGIGNPAPPQWYSSWLARCVSGGVCGLLRFLRSWYAVWGKPFKERLCVADIEVKILVFDTKSLIV